MKRMFSFFTVFSLLIFCLSACRSACRSENIETMANNKKMQVVTTIFPEYDWVMNILGENTAGAEVTMLLDNGVDLHSYQPTAKDILNISTCDLFIYVGGESDAWVESALKEATNKDMQVINLLEVLGDRVKKEEIKEGMEHEHEHEHEEIDEKEVKERSLAEFAGEWKSLFPLLQAGELDEYVKHHAAEHGEPEGEVRTELAEKWAFDAERVKIDGSTVTFTKSNGETISAEYTYAGYMLMRGDDGDITGVRYQFETQSAHAPQYLQFNDHQYEPVDKVEHFHIYFGDDGFEALGNSTSNPFFVSSEFSTEEILEELMGGEEHEHSKEVSNFENDEVKDRSLSDWEGDWQSPYPLLLDGTLDKAFESMAETKGNMTAKEYKEYYRTGYKTDIRSVKIDGNHIEYTFDNGKKVGSDYKYVGYFIQDWSGGTRAAMYRFETVDREAGVPIYIEINDHMIEPAQSEHFHLRMSDESYDAIVDPENSWPTFFTADMSGEEICEHLAGHEHDEGEKDEHVWLSLQNASALVQTISETIQNIDPSNANIYRENTDVYLAKLSELDKAYRTATQKASFHTLLFGDRFPFRYLVDDYGLDYFAAFAGCSAETEASFNTIAFLSQKVDELNLPAVLTIEGTNHRIAETIIQNTQEKNQKILTVDSMQSTTAKDIQNGITYLSIMEKNLSVLKDALE